MSAPKSFTGYLVENPGYAPPKRTRTSWLYLMPPLFYTLGDARAQQAAFSAMAPDDEPKPVFKVTVTFETLGDDTEVGTP